MTPQLERMTFAIMLFALAELCWKANLKGKAFILGAGGVIFFVAFIIRQFNLVQGLAP
jgi:hypothetical protein